MLHDVLFLLVSFCVSVLYLCIKEQFAKTVSTSVWGTHASEEIRGLKIRLHEEAYLVVQWFITISAALVTGTS